jgi:MFS transporter, PPP family, 3-phenylpropionic acid transporter
MSMSLPLSTRPALSGSLFYLGHWAAFGLFSPFINVYFAELGLNGRQIGWLSALVPLTTLIIAPLVSAVADRTQRRVAALRWSILLTVFSFLWLGWETAFVPLLLAMSFHALVRAPTVSLADTLIARQAVRYGLNFGTMRLWGSVGFAAMAIGGGWVWQAVGYAWMLPVTAVLLLPSVWLANGLEEPAQPVGGGPEVRPWDILRLPSLQGILLACFLAGLALGLSFVFEGLYMVHKGGNGWLVGLMFGLAACSELPSMQATDALGRGGRMRWLFLLSFVVLAVAMVGYVFSPTPLWVLLFAAVRGLGFGFFLVSSVRLVDALAPAEWASTAQSLRQAVTFGLAALVAGPLGGWLVDMVSLEAVFMASAGCVLAAAVLVAFTPSV